MEKPARFCRRDMYMHFFYELKESSMEIEKKTSVHVPPHLHRSLECIFVTSGTLELGIGTELFHMNTGDFGIVFPEQIHHYQVFDSAFCQAVYLLAAPSLSGPFSDHLQNFVPEYPLSCLRQTSIRTLRMPCSLSESWNPCLDFSALSVLHPDHPFPDTFAFLSTAQKGFDRAGHCI